MLGQGGNGEFAIGQIGDVTPGSPVKGRVRCVISQAALVRVKIMARVGVRVDRRPFGIVSGQS